MQRNPNEFSKIYENRIYLSDLNLLLVTLRLEHVEISPLSFGISILNK